MFSTHHEYSNIIRSRWTLLWEEESLMTLPTFIHNALHSKFNLVLISQNNYSQCRWFISRLNWKQITFFINLLTPSLRRPCIHAIFFSTACRTACKHAFRFLRVLPEAVSTRHSWLWQTLDDVYTRRCFSESEGNTLRCPRTKGTAVGEWVNGMEWVNGFLPNPFIHDWFCWSSRHKFVKTVL